VKVESFLVVFSGLFGFPRLTPIKVVPIGFRSVLQPFGYTYHQIEPFLLQMPVAQAVESTHPPNNPLLEGSQIAGLSASLLAMRRPFLCTQHLLVHPLSDTLMKRRVQN
jgi:hypothetical protein